MPSVLTQLRRRPIPNGCQHITDADQQAVIDTLYSGFLTQMPWVAEFGVTSPTPA